jgi:hypothetical protein
MWNKEGLEFYYTVEKNWKEIYNDKAKYYVLINGWETWEPKDKSKNDVPQEKDWWEKEEEGCDTDSKVNTTFL